jgi:protein transport protein SEC24
MINIGLKIGEHYGNFHMENTTDVEFAGVDADTAFAAEVKYEGKLDEKHEAAFQCVILYTSYSGQRRIRVHNLSLQVTSLLGDVFRFADIDTSVNYLAKQSKQFLNIKPHYLM